MRWWLVFALMVCVASGSQITMSASLPGAISALLRVDAEELGWIDAAQLDPAVEREAPAAHAMRVEHHHAVLDARHAVGNLREVALAKLLAGLRPSLPPSYQKSQWSVEMTCRSFAATAFQSASWSRHLAERRRADPLRALEAGTRQVVLGEEEVLEAGLAVDAALATLARQPDRLDRASVGDVDDVERRASHLGQPNRAVRRLGLQLRLGASARGTSARSARRRAPGFTRMSIASPFSAWTMMSRSCLAACSIARKSVASSTISAPL